MLSRYNKSFTIIWGRPSEETKKVSFVKISISEVMCGVPLCFNISNLFAFFVLKFFVGYSSTNIQIYESIFLLSCRCYLSAPFSVTEKVLRFSRICLRRRTETKLASSPTIANLYMENCEQKAQNKAELNSTSWKVYLTTFDTLTGILGISSMKDFTII